MSWKKHMVWKVILASSLMASLSCLNASPSIAALNLPSPVCSGNYCTITLSGTSDYYLWTVPASVSLITATVIGGSGGKGYWTTQRPLGGYGAKLTETITVNAGDQLYFYVGGAGGDGGNNIKGAAGASAAGSSGGLGGSTSGIGGGGGGAASEIRRNGTAISTRIVVAGGGGGASGGCSGTEAGDTGGTASGNTGGTGLCTGYSATNVGAGATITSDGAGGNLRNGRSSASWGGAGGGGYFGGGAGSFGGGGAGSSWIDSNYVVGSFASASTFGSGSISFAYPYVPPSFSSLNLGSGENIFRLPSNLSATASEDGFVTFQANGKRIPGCIKVATSSRIASCVYRPSTRGSIQITVLFYKERLGTTPLANMSASSLVSTRATKR